MSDVKEQLERVNVCAPTFNRLLSISTHQSVLTVNHLQPGDNVEVRVSGTKIDKSKLEPVKQDVRQLEYHVFHNVFVV